MNARSFTIVQKFGLLGAVGFLGAVVTDGAGWVAVTRYQDLSTELASKTTAQNIIRELDTRASELKVDGYKAIVRPKAAEELDELAEDSDKITTRLAKLAALDLPVEDNQRIESLSAAFQDYVKQADVSHNVRTVAAGPEEMGASIAEIARSSQEAAQVASDAVRDVEETTGRMLQLSGWGRAAALAGAGRAGLVTVAGARDIGGVDGGRPRPLLRACEPEAQCGVQGNRGTRGLLLRARKSDS
jgi:hypothetical protein